MSRAHWDDAGKRVVGNRDVRLCCCRVRTAAQADAAETQSVAHGISEVVRTVGEASGGFANGLLDVVSIGGVQRTASAGQVAAIAVVKAEVPGATARVVRALQTSVPVGTAVACAAIALPSLTHLASGACLVIGLVGVPFGLTIAYAPVSSERDRIQRKAAQAGAEAGSFMTNVCRLQ